MTPETLLALLDTWDEEGWIRPLDRALVRFFNEKTPDCPGSVLLAAALVSHQLGRGHVCLDLAQVLDDPAATLGLPPPGRPDPKIPPPPLQGLTLETWRADLAASALVAAAEGSAPLVLDNGRLYLRRYWEYTRQVARQIRDRLDAPWEAAENLASRLDRIFAPYRSLPEREKQATDFQSVAAAMAARSGFCVISGGPGTGKTFTVIRLLALLLELAAEKGKTLRVSLAAPTGKAAARLTESLGKARAGLDAGAAESFPDRAVTLHRLLGSRPDSRRFRHHRDNPLHLDLLVVDEASMIDLEMMAALLDALPPRARLVLLGDKDQLASVEAGSVLGDLCRNAGEGGYTTATLSWIWENTGYRIDPGPPGEDGGRLAQHTVLLKKSHRFKTESGIGALARAVNAGDASALEAVWEKGFADIGRIVLPSPDADFFAELVIRGESAVLPSGASGFGPYLEMLGAGPRAGEGESDWHAAILERFGRFRILTALRNGPWGVAALNQAVETILFRAGLLAANQAWYAGRPVMVTRNDYSLGLMNGDIGLTLPSGGAETQGLMVVFPLADGSQKSVRPARLGPVETVFAMTVHKSQGSEFAHAVLVLPETPTPILTRELIYTGITRAAERFTLAGPRPELMGQGAARRTHRASGLADLLARSAESGPSCQ